MDGRALVLDTAHRQGIVTVRSLGRAGVTVTAASEEPLNPGGVSRYAADSLRIPGPENPNAFVDALERELRRRSYDVLLPIRDESVDAVLGERERLERHAAIPYTDRDTLEQGRDKYLTVQAARAVGLAHPQTATPETVDYRALDERFGFPVVVKPRVSAGRQGVVVCDDRAAVEDAVERITETFGDVILQEFIPNGGERGVYTIYDWDSQRRATCVQERIRTNPPEGGSSTLRKTIEAPDLIRLGDRLLSSLSWQGLGMAEFRIDPRDGEPKLLEINTRPWGSLALSVHAGVDFPRLQYQLGAEGRCEEVDRYVSGVESRRVIGDISHFLARDDRLAAARELLESSPRRREYDVFSMDDPLPAIAYTASEVSGFLGRRVSVTPSVENIRTSRGSPG
jgi:predicted ATP-grasp superfamily ATP-dependent carboligase